MINVRNEILLKESSTNINEINGDHSRRISRLFSDIYHFRDQQIPYSDSYDKMQEETITEEKFFLCQNVFPLTR